MLQPREKILRPDRWIPFSLRTICIVLCICIQTGLAQNSDDVFIVEPTPALRLNSQDLTTILLLNNNKNNNPNNRGTFGRHHHHHANVGLLTSTARTFIQEGVTTEYATQVLGTTLDNGRLYAQLLKKSSRVLYDKDNDEPTIAPTAKFPGAVQTLQTYSAKSPRTLLQSHNDLVGDKDWQLIDDHLLLVNKDQLSRTEEFTRKAEPGSVLVFPAKSQPLNEDQQRFANQSFSVSQSSSSSSASSPFVPALVSSNEALNIAAQKVLQAGNLPTYTIKNVFAPSGFSWDSPIDDAYVVDERAERVPKFRMEQQQQQQRTPKLLQHDSELLGNDLRNMATVTYFGFADFTTVVGDTVIVFSPSTSSEASNHGQVTSIKGEATLNGVPQTTAFVTHVPITVTQDLIEPTFTMQQVVGMVQPTVSIVPLPVESPTQASPEEHDGAKDLSELTMPDDSDSDYDDSSEEYVATTQFDDTSEEPTTQKQPDETPTLLQSIEGNQIELESSLVAVEETTSSSTISPTIVSAKPMLSIPSNEDVSKIFASLASLEAAKKLAAATTIAEAIPSQSIVEDVQPETTTAETVNDTKPTTDKPNDTTEHMEPIETTTMEDDVANNDVSTESIKDMELYPEPLPTMPNKIVDFDEKEEDVKPTSATEPDSITPDTKVSGGVTTIFFEDDPFLGLEVTPTQQVTTAQSTAAVPPTEPPSPPTTPEPEVTTVQPGDEDEVKEEAIDSPQEVAECQDKTSEVIPTLVPKTLIYLTTFFISDADQTSTSIETNALVTFEVSHSTKLFCEQIITSAVVNEPVLASSTVTRIEEAGVELPADEAEILSSISVSIDEAAPTTTSPLMIVTEKVHVTTEPTMPIIGQSKAGEEPEHESTSSEEEEEDDDEAGNSEQSGEEIELIHKTLYTTYTYLTTFFHESTTSVSSRKEVITNVITSTISPNALQNSADVTELLSSITPTAVQQEPEASATEVSGDKAAFAQSDRVKIDDILRKDEDLVAPTSSLDDEHMQANGVKTYYTTYTYFTTIFVESETEISSRTEVYTNYVTEGADHQIGATSREEPERLEFTVSDDDNKVVNDISPTSTYHQPAQTNSVRLVEQALDELSVKQNANILESSFVSSSSSSSNEITMVTDIKSSSSDGDRHIIENINKHWNGLLEDQISSESNTEEILPSSTLLLQTSYTTFTYFTTMYIGNTASSILSRLETITNVVTETLQPTQMLKVEDSTLPITYFTTFTYWTTLYKDGEITTISREETASNIVTPTAVLEAIESTATIEPVLVSALSEQAPVPSVIDESSTELAASGTTTVDLSSSTIAANIEPTTFYTTYTYFTTHYNGDEPVINSRFETVTNVNTPSDGLPIPQPTLDLPPASTVTTPAPASDPAVPSVSAAEPEPPTVPTESETIIEINQGKIVDAEGISTLLYTTKTIATTINDTPTTIVQSTSSLSVDEMKRALASTIPTDSSTRTYKTGLVRLIDGTIIANQTTTLYQSKVIGTIIEGRYAQIIESTSSFLIEKTLSPSTAQVDIIPTAVQSPMDGVILQTTFVPTGATDIVEGSISDAADETTEAGEDGDQEEEQDEEEGDETPVDENGRKKSRLTFQTKKKTFSPVIRPFASRNRPQFAPKRKNVGPSSATIITRSDFTPTITATPALKSDSSRGRFSSNRKGSSILSSSGAVQGSSRKFSRPGGSSSRGFAAAAPSSAYPGGSRRGFSSGSRIQPTASSSYFGGSTSRRGGSSSQRGFAGSSSFGRPAGASSIYPGKSRLNIRSSSVIPNGEFSPNTNIYTTQEPDVNDEGTTQINPVAEEEREEIEITTESLRRPGNNLLSFRRPPIVGKNLGVSQRRNPLTQRPKPTSTTTTTTPRPKPRAFQRPSIAPFGNRPRVQPSGLFPPRGLFKPQNINEDLNESKKQQDEDTNDFGDDLEGDEYDDEEEDDIEDEELNSNRRSKRQAPSFRNRFRRPGAAKAEEKTEPVEETPQPAPTRGRSSGRNNNGSTGRNNNNNRNNNNKKSPQNKNNNGGGNNRIRPTKASSSTRAQFTLREKDTATKPSRASSFRRPTTSGNTGSSRRTPPTVGRPKAPRLKTFSNSVTESTRSTAGRSRTTSRGRSTTRSRGTTEYRNVDPVLPAFDGTITVTHHIPTEITIPVVNGKVTEYKNIITAQVSTEVLGPNQYNTLVDRLGSSLLVLAREDTTINNNGATEVTQFILHETPTTSVIFTPTTIRGRRTSFSHIIPSTVYDVENVVSTIQPQIAAQAPLANILLSQLLLGNIGLGQQQQLNPLLGLGGPTGMPGVPTTEFKIRTTTYVTTVTEGMSTVIPLTFRGKEILTTIFDSTVNVITATEFITDTVVVTPTAAANVQQVNSLLLPLLLQQQAQGAQPILPIQNSALPQQFGQDTLLSNVPTQQLQLQQQNLFQDGAAFRGDLDSNRIQKVNFDDFQDVHETEQFPEQDTFREAAATETTTRSRKRHHRKGNKHGLAGQAAIASEPSPALETSVVTLYVSGRRPGEFSTILSTVVGQEQGSLRKRHAEFVPVEKSAIVDYGDMYKVDESEIKDYLLPATNDIGLIASSQMPAVETQSLESIVGDVSRWFEAQSEASSSSSSVINQSPITITHSGISTAPFATTAALQTTVSAVDIFEGRSAAADMGIGDGDSLLYDESGRFFNFAAFEGLQSSTPPTANGGGSGVDEARYNLATRIMSNGVEVIVAGDKSKTVNDRSSVLRILPSRLEKPMTLAPSTLHNQMILIAPGGIDNVKESLTLPINPNQFVTKTCLTTYTYRTTYLQDGTTTIESREKVISNIATEERNYLKISPTSTSGVTLSRTPEFVIGVFHTTYTYLNTILDGELPIVLSSKHTVTNTITGPEDYISFLQPSEEATPMHETNTYYSKITLTKTLHDSDIEKIVSTSNVLRQVVITESLPSKSTSILTSYIALDATDTATRNHNDLHIYATKTYLTTFTYFTTILKSQTNDPSHATEVNSHIRVVENVITESIPNHLIEQEVLSDFRKQLDVTTSQVLTTLATLVGGQTLEVTAMRTPYFQQHSQPALASSAALTSELYVKSSALPFSEPEQIDDQVDEGGVAVDDNYDDSKDDENDDNLTDSLAAASSNHNAQLYNAVVDPAAHKNHTKLHDKNGFQVSNLIGSFNLNRLNALGPVINAMAGLINTNFGAGPPIRKDQTNVKHTANEISSKNLLKNISSSPDHVPVPLDQAQQPAPIYIPVRSSNDLLMENRLSSPASLHIAPPKPVASHAHVQKYLLQSDEKANRNNKLEILVGKPTYETPLLNGGIPISPGEVITANSDVIIGKPGGIRPRIPFENTINEADLKPPLLTHPLQTYQTSPKLIPLLPYQSQRPHPNYLRPPLPALNPGYKNQYPSIPLSPSLPQVRLQNNVFPHQSYAYQHGRFPQSQPQSQQQPLNNEILEIKRIPEVFSADLPVFEMKKVHGGDKTMLVNIQPSQVANVMIPHGNTSPVLIIESTAELHKNGQYFDEPSPYPNTILTTDTAAEANQGPAPVSDHSKAPASADLINAPIQVSLDSSVLSHNIDVHVPPLTFIKENEYPQTIPIRGHAPSYYNRAPVAGLRPGSPESSSSHPAFHRTQHYPVEGMEPPPKRNHLESGIGLPKKYHHHHQHFNSRPYQPPPQPDYHHYNTNTFNSFLEAKYPASELSGHVQPPTVPLPSSYDSPPHVAPPPLFDNSPIEHSQAPSIGDEIKDQHRDDDYENEEGEVIQESNSLPVIPGQYIDYPTTSTSFNIPPFLNMPSASAINELPHMEPKKDTSHNVAGNVTKTHAFSTTARPVSSTDEYADSLGAHYLQSVVSTSTTNKEKKKRPAYAESFSHPGKLGSSYGRPQGSGLVTSSSTHPGFGSTDSENFRRPLGSGLATSSSTHPGFTSTTTANSGNGIHFGLADNLHAYVQASLPFDYPVSEEDHSHFGANKSNQSSSLSTPIQTEKPFSLDVDDDLTLLQNTSIVNDNDLDKESSEIFDYKESINPHNLQVINDLEELPSEAGSFDKPTTAHFPTLTTEEVVGMSPPPLPSRTTLNTPISGLVLRKPQRPAIKMSPPPVRGNSLAPYNYPATKSPYPLHPYSQKPSFTRNTITTRSPVTSPLASSSESTPTTTGLRPISTTTPEAATQSWTKSSEQTTPTAEPTSTKPVRYSVVHRRPVTSRPSPTPITSTSRVPVTKVRLPSLVLTTKLDYGEKTDNSAEKIHRTRPTARPKLEITATPSIKVASVARNESTLTNDRPQDFSDEMISEVQKFPDDILVEGSEMPMRTTPTAYFTHKETITVTKPLNVSTRTRLVSKIVLPTKYITNTKTLTVTTTKTTVIKSQGIPSTQTLILTTTQTSTLVDTVTQTQTQTQTETLLQPTKITLDPTTQLYTTVTTVYTMPPPHNPEKEPTPPDDVIDDVIEDNRFAETGLDTNVAVHTTSPMPAVIFKGSPVTPSIVSRIPATQKNQSANQHGSIFVVMTDQKNMGLINLGSDPNHLSPTLNAIDAVDNNLDLPNRDEDTNNGESNHVLLGGVLIASPPKASSNSLECRPDCKGSRNEVCQNLDSHMRCVCRAGFARMFPDRPCKPTYTYQLSIPLQRIGKEMLVYDEHLGKKDSETFFNLASATHEAVDRMVMQSDFRDIYHGVHVTGLERAANSNGVIGKFYLQLSDSSDEQRLVDVFRKYLRGTNYSVGGTELYSAQTSGLDDLQASDFDECLNREFHDCSDSAHCFNLHGTYTCSCKEGYADLSENPVYPGRICSTEQIGCEKCHYHGSCYARDLIGPEDVVCECFPWYAGASCQLNLKILLIALVAFGALLLILLFFCLLITCSKRRKNRSMQAIISGINILPPKGSSLFMGSNDKLMKLDKRAMIKDSSSEASHSLDTLPYVTKSYAKESSASKKQSVGDTSRRHSTISPAPPPTSDLDRHCNLLDQNDRSLTVMIPRAKYHPVNMPANSNDSNGTGAPLGIEAKLLSYWDAGASTGSSPSKKLSSASAKQQQQHYNAIHTTSTGALVSAGFEVSATVGNQDVASTLDSKSHLMQKSSKHHSSRNSIPNSDTHSQYGAYKKQPPVDSNVFMESIDAWSNALHQTELTASEVRSYDETTIQPQTKSFLSAYDKQMSQMNNDEANTMAERDVGSTFLLPHTHLYKPDRASDEISGFDSF